MLFRSPLLLSQRQHRLLCCPRQVLIHLWLPHRLRQMTSLPEPPHPARSVAARLAHSSVAKIFFFIFFLLLRFDKIILYVTAFESTDPPAALCGFISDIIHHKPPKVFPLMVSVLFLFLLHNINQYRAYQHKTRNNLLPVCLQSDIGKSCFQQTDYEDTNQ